MNRLAWGFLSTARINERLLGAIRSSERSDVRAVASRSVERAREYTSARGIPVAYGRYEELLADDAIDAVYISLPNALHAPWVIAAARAGKHVYCEKPLATSAADVEQIIEVAQASGVVVAEACAMSYHAQTALLRNVIASGKVGDVLFVRGWLGFTLPSAEDPRLDPALGGGSLWDLGCYPIGLVRAMLDQTPVTAFGRAISEVSGVDMSFCGEVQYEGGAVAQVATSMCAPANRSFDVIGTRGSVRVTEPYLTRIGVTSQVFLRSTAVAQGLGTFGDDPDPNEREVEVARYESPNAYADALGVFESTVLERLPSPLPLAETRWNVAVAEALHRSWRSGVPEPVERGAR